MPVYKDSKTDRLYIEFQYKGVRYKERLHEGATKKDAEKLEIKVKNDLMFERHGVRSGLTFEDFIDKYFGPVADQWDKQRRDRAILLVKACMPFLKGKPMRDIKAADIGRVKASRASLLTMHGTIRKPATIEREMSVISSIFSMAVENDVIDYNPCGRVKRIKFNNEVNRILRREDEELLFNNMHSEWARDICKMALYTGLRQNDIMKLTRFQVDLAAGVISLVQGKTTNRIVLPLHPVAAEIIKRRMCNGLLFASPVTGTEKGSVRHAMYRACTRAKIPVVTIRDLRRTFATRQIEEGNDFTIVAQNMGHQSTRMMSRYTKSLDAQRKSVESLANPAKFPALAKK